MRLRILLLLALSPILNYAQAPVCADPNPTRNCCGVTALGSCPVIGCGGDPELNTKKNRTDIPVADIEPKTFAQLGAFKRPQSWASGTGRFLLETWGEGKAIELKGFIFEASNYTSNTETTNCHLKTSDVNDFHIVLVEDLILADKWKIADEKVRTLEAEGGTSTTAKNKLKAAKKAAKRAHERAEKKSLTAEITPRLRPAVTPVGTESVSDRAISLLRRLAREFAYVRVTGWAMLDTQHIAHPINRRSNWEIHPVTKFEVCTATLPECDAGTGWTRLEDIP